MNNDNDNNNNNNNNDSNSNNRNTRILLVDDEYDIALTFKIGLEDSGFVVDSFTDPSSALLNFKTNSYDLLLLDVKMPKIDGFELCRQMKKIDDKVKVCFMTAFDVRKSDLKVDPTIFNNNNNSKQIIQKPISIDDLVKQVKAELS
ncbi:MAG: response regulator [Nitrososphaeraceae archaeon]